MSRFATHKTYVRLKDKSTIFYDSSQDLTVVSDRIAIALVTAEVSAAIANGRLIELSPEEAKGPYKKQQYALMDANIIPDTRSVKEESEEAEEAEPSEGTEETTEDVKSNTKPQQRRK